MPPRDRRLDRAIALAKRLKEESEREIRTARIGAAITQEAAGRAVGISHSQYGRFERGELEDVTIEQLCRMAAAVGLTVHLRLYPDADPVRDAAHLRLLERFRASISADLRWRSEVPLRGVGDPRSWDGIVEGHGCRDAVEAETRLSDIQATERRFGAKLRDDPSVRHLIVVAADTRTNRRAVALGRSSLASLLPGDGRAALAALRTGRCPGESALILL